MLPASIITKISTQLTRRSLSGQKYLVQYSLDKSVASVTIDRSQRDHRHRRQSRPGSLSLAGAVLGAAVIGHSNDREEGWLASLLSRLSVNAAEPLPGDKSGGSGDRSGGSGGKSRRGQFNFIADLVEETAPGLVYIEIKDGGVRDYYTGQPVTVSNGSGFIVDSNGLILTNAHVVVNKPRASIQVSCSIHYTLSTLNICLGSSARWKNIHRSGGGC